MWPIADLELLQAPDKKIFLKCIDDRKSSLLPQLVAATQPFLYIVDQLQNLKMRKIEREPLEYDGGAGQFSDLSVAKFEDYMSEHDGEDIAVDRRAQSKFLRRQHAEPGESLGFVEERY